MSSQTLVPIIEHLWEHAEVFALDTPGYGQSDPLTQEALASRQELAPYVAWLKDFLDTQGLEKLSLYRSATGAQIALEFACAYPQHVSKLVLENAAHFSEEECKDVLKRCFPSIAPKVDGSRLNDEWHMAQSFTQ